jgi:nitroreductase / dihydropteridine reductase
MELVNWLNWRYATKSYNGEIVPADKLDYILEAARLAPTSSGLQAFKIFVISNKEIKEKMQPIAMNQAQVVESSHVLVFASWDKYDDERIDDTFVKMTEARGFPTDQANAYKTMLKGHWAVKGEAWQANHTARQTYIAAAMAMAAAAELKVDATPMEGFDNDALDALLNLKEQGLKSQVMVALGYRKPDDWNTKMPKFRRSKEELIESL